MLNLVKQNIEIEPNSKSDLESIFPDITTIVPLLKTNAINNIAEITTIMEDIIEKIDNYNAATTIGTLDFIDQIAKLNSVENSCYDFDIDSGENKYGFASVETRSKTTENIASTTTQPTTTQPTTSTTTQPTTSMTTQPTTSTTTQPTTITVPLTNAEKKKQYSIKQQQASKEQEEKKTIKKLLKVGGMKHKHNITRRKCRK